MPLLLLSTKYNKWLRPKPDWLGEGEIPADPIFALKTQDNTMSVWLVDNDRSCIKRIVGALAATRQALQEFEYVLLDSKTVTDVGIKTHPTEGTSIDSELNKFHLDLIEISAQKLVKLAKTILEKIWQEDTRFVEQRLRKTVARNIFDNISKGRIDSANVNPKVLDKAQEVLGYSVNEIS